MTAIWTLVALWLGLALVASLFSIWFRVATAMSEIILGTIAQFLTFLAGAELDPVIFRAKWKEAGAIGFISFFAPFLGCAAAAHYGLHWAAMSSWLAGVALSTTSVAVGLSHGIIDQGQYSTLVATVIGSAVIPTLIANAFYLPKHLLKGTAAEELVMKAVDRIAAETALAKTRNS